MMRRASLAAIAVLFLYGSPAQALTQHVSPPGNSGVSEYQEDVPSAGGSVPVIKLPSNPRGHQVLPHSVVQQLDRAGATGRAVAAFVDRTAPAALGEVSQAPSSGTRTGAHRSGSSRPGGAGASRPGAAGANPAASVKVSGGSSVGGQLAAAVIGGSGGGLGLLLPVILAALLGGALTALLLRRRRPR
jgi:hypothetical protein